MVSGPVKVGFWRACAYVAIVQLLAIGLQLVSVRIFDVEPSGTAIVSLTSLAMACVVAWGARRCAASELARTFALRPFTLLHFSLVILVVFPWLVVSLSLDRWAATQMEAFFDPGAGEAKEAVAVRDEGSGRDDEAMVADAPPGGGESEVAERARTVLYDLRVRRDALLTDLYDQPRWLGVLVAGLWVAVWEELFFRGLLGQGLIARFGAVRGVLVTSVLFGITHVEPVVACVTFLMGLLLHLVFLATRSLFAPILLHGLNNTISTLHEELEVLEPTHSIAMAQTYRVPAGVLAAALVCMFLIAWLFYRSRIRGMPPSDVGWAEAAASAAIPTHAGIAGFRSHWKWLAATIIGYTAFLHVLTEFGQEAAVAMHVNRGNILYELEDYHGAIDSYSEAIRRDSQTAVAYYRRAIALLETGQPAKAIWDCTRSIEFGHRADAALALRGRAYFDLEKYSDAIADCSAAIEFNGLPAMPYRIRGIAWMMEGDLEAAMRDLDAAIERAPTDSLAHYNRGRVLQKRGEWAAAIDAFDRVIALGDDEAISYFARAVSHYSAGNLEVAAADCDEALARDSAMRVANDLRGVIRLIQGDELAAAAELAAALRIEPNDAEVHRMRAAMLLRRDEFTLASRELDEAIRIAPYEPACLNARAWFHATCRDPAFRNGSIALADASRACELTNWEVPEYVDTLAAAYAECGQYDEAVRWQQAAINLLPPSQLRDFLLRLDQYESNQPHRDASGTAR